MQLTSGVEIPDGLLAAMPQLAENSRQGFEQITGTMHWASGFVISHTSLGISGPLYDTRTESRYTGKERDAESGLDYFGARYYGSTMGRWMSPDLVNVTEDRMMYPSSTLNKYAYGANNPLKYVDPDGQDITIFYEPGNPYPGHTMLLAYNQETGDSATRSFGPANHSLASVAGTTVNVPVAGTDRYDFEDFKTADDIRSKFQSITIQTTPEEAQAVIQAIRTHPDGNYTTYWNNCTTTCSKLLRSIGKTSSHALTPEAFFTDLFGQYNKQPSNNARGVPGARYGQVRPGYDPFQLFFNAFPQDPTEHERVRSRIVPDSIKPVDPNQQ